MIKKKNLIRQSRLLLLVMTVVAAIIVYTCLSAQTSSNGFSDERDQMRIINYSSFSNSSKEARSSFSISAEIVESVTSIETSELTEVLLADGTVQKMGLTVSPPRLVFENDNKTAVLTLTNIGELDTVYHIQLVNTVVDETGKRKQLTNEELSETNQKGALFAHRMLKFAPRQVRLKPREQQMVRVAVLAPERLDDGEYRSELNFSWQADAEKITRFENLVEQLASNTARNATESANTNIAEVKSENELYVPIIVRKGELAATGKLVDLQLESSEETTTLSLKIVRDGNRSINGDLLIYGLNQHKEKTGLLQTVRRIAVYPPTAQHEVSADISEAINKAEDDIDSLLIEYKASSDEGRAVIDSAEIKLLAGARVSADK